MQQRNNLIPVGAIAPNFTASDEMGRAVTLEDFRGRKHIILIFYPADNTSVCTAQLCAARDAWSEFEAADTLVFGVNPARAEKHQQFAQKHAFPFPLIVDQGGAVAALYGCRMLFGLIRRAVYIIDKQGRVAYAKAGNPPPQEILRLLAGLQNAL